MIQPAKSAVVPAPVGLGRYARPLVAMLAAGALVAGCAAPSRIGDARAQALLAYSTPEFYAERGVALDLANACPRYRFDTALDDEMGAARAAQGRGPTDARARSGAIDLERDIKERSLAANYGADFNSLNPCTVLDGEAARLAPLSVLVVAKG